MEADLEKLKSVNTKEIEKITKQVEDARKERDKIKKEKEDETTWYDV
jgi:hypothetical protein